MLSALHHEVHEIPTAKFKFVPSINDRYNTVSQHGKGLMQRSRLQHITFLFDQSIDSKLDRKWKLEQLILIVTAIEMIWYMVDKYMESGQ